MGIGRRRFFKRNTESETERTLSVLVPAVYGDIKLENQLFQLLDGIPVVAQTLLNLNGMAAVKEITVVIREARLQEMAWLCRHFSLERVKTVLCCDSPGFETLAMGIYGCDSDAAYIAVHNPLRPLFTAELFEEATGAAELFGAAVPAVPVKDTIKTVCEGVVQETPDRSSLYAVQAPFVVERTLLKAAIQRTIESGVEEADIQTAMEGLGLSVKLTAGTYENILIDSDIELAAAEAIVAWRRTRDENWTRI